MGEEGKVQAQVGQLGRRVAEDPRHAESLTLSCRGEPWLGQKYQWARESEESHMLGAVPWVEDGRDHAWSKSTSMAGRGQPQVPCSHLSSWVTQNGSPWDEPTL